MTKETQTPLNPHDFTKQIAKHPYYLSNMPRIPLDQSMSSEFQNQRSQAIKLGAMAVSHNLMEQRGVYDLDANLFALTAQLDGFYQGQQQMNAYHEKYDRTPRHAIPFAEKNAFYGSKEQVTSFNHALKEVINAGGNKLSFNDLLTFMTNMGQAINRSINPAVLHDMTKEVIIGMRNEVAYEQILIAAGIDYENGDVDDDAHGCDFIIHGKRADVGIDVKASQFGVERSQQKARSNGYDATTVVWSHVNFEDFNGMLCLPYDAVDAKVPAVRHDLSQILRSTANRYATVG